MQTSKNSAIKNQITQAILTGAVVMLIFFVISLFLPKEWLVSGKIVVFPSGQPVSASVNLALEVGNTAQIIKSESFQKNYFGDFAANFSGEEVLEHSSMVLVKFRSSEKDIQDCEDLIVKIPSQVNEYARDIYEGSPFKYKMVADPEISTSPVRPNLLLNAAIGFLAGIVLYLIYWYISKLGKIETPKTTAEKKKSSSIALPEVKSAELAEKKTVKGKAITENGRLHFVPGESADAGGKKVITPKNQTSAPENLPFVEEGDSSDIQEPSDEEVKERLNRLMRGEL